MRKKYEFVNDFIEVNGRVLYRIKALVTFSNVRSGDLGGYIEHERNLSHRGECWVGDDAKVYGKARVDENARVYNNATVKGHVLVCGNARVYKNATVKGHAFVCEDAQVYENATVKGHAEVFGDSKVFCNAIVGGHLKVCGFDEVRYRPTTR